MAHCSAVAAQREKTRFHKPLGNAADLARHLILRLPAGGRVVNFLRVVKFSQKRPVRSKAGHKRG